MDVEKEEEENGGTEDAPKYTRFCLKGKKDINETREQKNERGEIQLQGQTKKGWIKGKKEINKKEKGSRLDWIG